MLQFIPFEDDWDALEKLQPGTLVPYRVGMVPAHDADQPPPGPCQTPACSPRPLE